MIAPLRLDQGLSDRSADLLIVYPNPADGSFKVSLRVSNNITDPATIQIFDQTGKLLLSVELSMENGVAHELPVDNLPKGLYSIRVVTSKEMYQNRLIIQ